MMYLYEEGKINFFKQVNVFTLAISWSDCVAYIWYRVIISINYIDKGIQNFFKMFLNIVD